MSLAARLYLLGKQLKENKKLCNRCLLPYDPDQKNCPHCTSLSERQVEELVKNNSEIPQGFILHLVLLFGGLAFLFVFVLWLIT